MKSELNHKFFYLPNWVELKNFKLNKPKNKQRYNFIFAGNIEVGKMFKKF